MDEWCTKTHSESGLTKRVQESEVTLGMAEKVVLDMVQKYEPNPRRVILCGNSIHVDRLFLVDQMKNLINHLHYRIIDVSSLKELCRMWYPDAFPNAPKKRYSHRALEDIEDTLEELKFYKLNILK